MFEVGKTHGSFSNDIVGNIQEINNYNFYIIIIPNEIKFSLNPIILLRF